MKATLGATLLGVFLLLMLLPGALASHPGHTVHCAADPDHAQCQEATVPEGGSAPKGGAAPKVPESSAKGPDASLLDQVAAFFGAVGEGIATGTKTVGEATSAAFVGLGALVVGLFRPLAELLATGRPEGMPVAAYASLTAGGTAIAAGGAQAGGWLAWKRLFPLGLPLLPLFSRIEKDELLDNERRARIFELIKQNPGIHLSEIARELEYAWGTTLHHLRKLRADRLILFKDVGHHKSFFVNGSGLSEQQMEAMSLVKNGTLAQLAHYLEDHPRTSLKELSEALKISPPLAAFHVRKLEKAGLVTKVRDGKSVRLTTSQTLPAGFFRGINAHLPGTAPAEAAS